MSDFSSEDTQPISVPATPPSTAKPSVGRIVFYVDTLSGSAPEAAIITKVHIDHRAEAQKVNLRVFEDGDETPWRVNVPFDPLGTTPGSWHWPPRV